MAEGVNMDIGPIWVGAPPPPGSPWELFWEYACKAAWVIGYFLHDVMGPVSANAVRKLGQNFTAGVTAQPYPGTLLVYQEQPGEADQGSQ
jgi:hypothetical protein